MEITQQIIGAAKEQDLSTDIFLNGISGRYEHYSFYLGPYSLWKLKVTQKLFSKLNDFGFDKVAIEKVNEPAWAKEGKWSRISAEGGVWAITHLPNKSELATLAGNEYGKMSLLDDLITTLRDETIGSKRGDLYREIGDRIGGQIFDINGEPKPEFQDVFLDNLSEKVVERIQSEFNKNPEIWGKVVEFHKALKQTF